MTFLRLRSSDKKAPAGEVEVGIWPKSAPGQSRCLPKISTWQKSASGQSRHLAKVGTAPICLESVNPTVKIALFRPSGRFCKISEEKGGFRSWEGPPKHTFFEKRKKRLAGLVLLICQKQQNWPVGSLPKRVRRGGSG